MADFSRRGLGEVEPGLTLDAIGSVQECDGVLDRLQAGIVNIERQLSTVRPGSVSEPADWRPRAMAAHRAKSFWLPRIQARRAELVRQERSARQADERRAAKTVAVDKRRLFMGLAWDLEPDAMRRVRAIARQRHPELFDEEDAA